MEWYLVNSKINSDNAAMRKGAYVEPQTMSCYGVVSSMYVYCNNPNGSRRM